jgi:hypothetical protein
MVAVHDSANTLPLDIVTNGLVAFHLIIVIIVIVFLHCLLVKDGVIADGYFLLWILSSYSYSLSRRRLVISLEC